MISQQLQNRINLQIKREMYSENLYLSMAAYLDYINLPGFANFFKVQVQEERFHTMKFFKYLNERGGRVIIDKMEKPSSEFESISEVFELAYKHEQFVSQSINELMEMAVNENDYATKSFLNWFVDEQVEEEASMEGLLKQLQLIDGKGQGLLMLDRELIQRVFTLPTVE